MRIACPNPDCKKTLKVKNALAGKKLKCPGCGQIIRIPRLRSEADAKRSVLSAEIAEKIRFKCTCGRSLAVASNLAGKKALCPSCGNIVPVPERADADTEIESTLSPQPTPPADEPKPEAPILPDEIAPEIVIESAAPSPQQPPKSGPKAMEPIVEEKKAEKGKQEDDEASTYDISLDDEKADTPPTGSHDIGVIDLTDEGRADAGAEEQIPVLSDEAEEEVPVLSAEMEEADEEIHILSEEMEDEGEDYVIPADQIESPPQVAACPYCGEAIEEGAAICTSCGTNILTGERIEASAADAGVRVPTTAPAETPSLWQAFGESFVYPFKGKGTQMIIAMPLINIFMAVAAIGVAFMFCAGPILMIFVLLAYLGMYFGLIFQVMKCAATGPGVEPEWPNFSEFWEEMFFPFMKLFSATLIFIGLPIAVVQFVAKVEISPGSLIGGGSVVDVIKVIFASIPIVAVTLIVWFCYPMTFTIVGIYESFLDGINPIVILRSVFRIPLDYFLIWLFLNALIAANIFAHVAMLFVLAMIPYGLLAGYAISPILSIYLWFVGASCLGFMSYRNRAKLGW